MKFKLSTFLIVVLGVLFSCQNSSRKSKSDKYTIDVFLDSIDSSLIENSGIVYWNKLIWTFNDSGGKNEIYGFNLKTGEVVRTIRISNALNTDWEDIAQDKNYIYLAEFGNNVGDRRDLQVLRFSKDSVSQAIQQEVSVDKIRFRYSDQETFNYPYKGHGFDAEALIAYKNELFLFTKDWKTLHTKVYKIPNEPGDHVVSPIESFNSKGLITGADINEKGKLALVGYANYKSFVWTFNVDEKSLFNSPHFIDLGMLQNAQTEGICFYKNDLFISCEKTTNYPQMVWRLKK